MRKILTLMSALTMSSIVALPVVACDKTQLDSILNTLSNNNGKYSAWDLGLDSVAKPTTPPTGSKPPKEQELTNDELKDKVAQNLANLILTKADSKEKIVWFNSEMAVGTKCYNFTIDNGEETTNGKKWEVVADTGRIAIDITYQVGSVNSDKTFAQSQKITKTFYLKCGYTISDFKVYKIVEKIDKLENHLVTVKVSAKTKPSVDSFYKDLSAETRTLINEAIVETINDPMTNVISSVVKEIANEKVTEIDKNNWQLKISFIISYQDTLIDMSQIPPYGTKPYPATNLHFKLS